MNEKKNEQLSQVESKLAEQKRTIKILDIILERKDLFEYVPVILAAVPTFMYYNASRRILRRMNTYRTYATVPRDYKNLGFRMIRRDTLDAPETFRVYPDLKVIYSGPPDLVHETLKENCFREQFRAQVGNRIGPLTTNVLIGAGAYCWFIITFNFAVLSVGLVMFVVVGTLQLFL